MIDMAKNLTACGNPLPGMTCSELNLPTGSTYGAAAKYVLDRGALDVKCQQVVSAPA